MTTLVRWDPLREAAAIHNEMSRLLGLGRDANVVASGRSWAPALDVWETDDQIVYAFDLPGVPEDRISIEIEDGVLTLAAERERPNEARQDRVYQQERRFGVFNRTIGLPKGVDEAGVAADYRDGVLEVRIAKPEQSKPRRVEIGTGERRTIDATTKAR
jgi:HSP20 family protein